MMAEPVMMDTLRYVSISSCSGKSLIVAVLVLLVIEYELIFTYLYTLFYANKHGSSGLDSLLLILAGKFSEMIKR